MDSTTGVTTVQTPWNIVSNTDLSIVKITGKNGFMVIDKDDNQNYQNSIGFMNFSGVSPTNGSVELATFEVKLKDSFSGTSTVLDFGTTTGSDAPRIGDSSLQMHDANGVKLIINKKSDTPVTEDQDLGYGIVKPADEPTNATYDVKPVIRVSPVKGGIPGVEGGPMITIDPINVDGATCYIYRSTNANSNFTKIKTTDCSVSNSYIDNDARIPIGNSITYYYRARVVGGTKVSDYASITLGGSSAIDEPITDPGDGEEIAYGILFSNEETEDPSLPKPSVDGDKPSVTDTTATITFDVGDAEGQCIIYRSTKEDSDFIEIKTVSCKGKTEYTDTGLNPDTSYYYRIRMVDSKKISDAILVKTLAAKSSGAAKDKDGEIDASTGTGAIIPTITLIGFAGIFMFTKKYYNDNSFFSRI